MSPQATTTKSTRSTKAASKQTKGFTAAERAAMKERSEELKKEARRSRRASQAGGESDLLAKIAEMPEPERAMAARLHELIRTTAPDLAPRTWYGMPAYARDGKVVCFFQSAKKFDTRYATLGFSDSARLDAGDLWPVAFALKALTPATEAKITALIKKAVR